MDYSKINDRKEICIDGRQEIEFYGYIQKLLEETSQYYFALDTLVEMINDYVNVEYKGDKKQFIKDLSICCDYYSLAPYLEKELNQIFASDYLVF